MSEKPTSGIVTGYGYTNDTCIFCQSIFHSGYPNCKEYHHSGAVNIVFDNCSSLVPVNICGSTPEIAERNTKEFYDIGSKIEGYDKSCEFHFFRDNAWPSVILGIIFFSVFTVLLSVGIYFVRKYNNGLGYQRV